MVLIFFLRVLCNYVMIIIIIINREFFFNKFDIYKEGINKVYEFDR